jgi:hypothetical protein
MGRRLPRSFFWIDQNVIRSGAWQRLSAEARLAYVALAASCDREGLSIWSVPKLMELAACRDREEWGARLTELEIQNLIERMPEHSPPAIHIKEIGAPLRNPNQEAVLPRASVVPHASLAATPSAAAPMIIHTQTTIHVGGAAHHVEPGKAD